MTSKTIPPEDERVSDEMLEAMICTFEDSVADSVVCDEIETKLALRVCRELQSRRSQPDREAIIDRQREEIGRLRRHLEVAVTIADRLGGGGVWRNSYMRKVADRWRSALSDTTRGK